MKQHHGTATDGAPERKQRETWSSPQLLRFDAARAEIGDAVTNDGAINS